MGSAIVSGLLAAMAPGQGELRLERINTLTVPGGNTMAAAFSPHGDALAMGGERGDLLVLELPAKRRRWSAQPSDHWIGVLAFSPDGNQLACCGRDLTFHDVATGRELDRIQGTGPRGFAWAPDGGRYVWCRGTELNVHDVAKQATVAAIRFEYPINATTVAPDGTIHAGDNVGRLWRIDPDAVDPVLVADRRSGEADSSTRAIAVLATGGELFELDSKGPLRRGSALFEVVGSPFAFAASADARSFAVGGERSLVRWWSEAGAANHELRVAGQVAALALHPDGHVLFVSTYGGEQALHGDDGSVVELPGHLAAVHGSVLNPDGTMLAMRGKQWYLQPVLGGGPKALLGVREVTAAWRGAQFLIQREKTLALFDARTGRELASIDNAASGFSKPVMGPGGTWLCGLNDAFVDPATKRRTDLPTEVMLVDDWSQVDQTAEGTWVLGSAGGIEGDVGTLLVTDAAGKGRFVETGGAVAAVAFSPDGTRLFSVRAHGISTGMGPTGFRLTVRKVRDLSVEREIPAEISAWKFLDEKRALVCVTGKLQVWDVATLAPVQTLDVDAPWYRFQLSADRRTLVRGNAYEVAVYRLHRD